MKNCLVCRKNKIELAKLLGKMMAHWKQTHGTAVSDYMTMLRTIFVFKDKTGLDTL